MQPTKLETLVVGPQMTPAMKRQLGGWAARFPKWQKGDKLPDTRVAACPRVRVADLPEQGFLKQKWIENLERNQLLVSCCRHPEEHEIEAFKSHPEETAPDIYIFHCTCGREHKIFCLGVNDERPVWSTE